MRSRFWLFCLVVAAALAALSVPDIRRLEAEPAEPPPGERTAEAAATAAPKPAKNAAPVS
jgi:hypothetical protein